MMTVYLTLFAIVLGVNLLPAFGPPTWSIIVLYGLNSQLPLPGLVLTGAVAAATGRFGLAHGFRLLRGHIPERMAKNVAAAGRLLQRRKRNTFLALGLFALSPVPSAQLFEAAGLAGIRLLPFTAAFFAGRLASYSLYAATAKGLEKSSLGDTFRHSLTSPTAIAIEVVMLLLLFGLTQFDWEKYFGEDATKR
ncbi:hypothetical protein [Sphingomonas sp.]|uniref:hypothetical protein n=1 Tax=Sphingomonas sp. TaxID=28214 RepID=UPI00325FC131